LIPRFFEGHVGQYQLTPTFILAISREDGQLFVQASEVAEAGDVSESERDYFLRVVDVQISRSKLTAKVMRLV
jgi:hypothetical protein